MNQKKENKVLIVSTSRKTRGGITAVLKLYEQSQMWQDYHCKWVGTHRDGNMMRKIWYLTKGYMQYIILLPFYDIVHFHISLPATVKRKYPLFKLAKILGKKTIIHLHCGSQIDTIWSDKYEVMFKQCDYGILLSESLRQKIEEHIGKSNKLKVIYNPCPVITNSTCYEKKNHILFSATLYEGKGYKDLIRAFAKIADKFPNWKIVLVGNGEVERAKSLATELGVIDKVELLGWVSGEEKHRAFSEAQALCLPSYAEGFPMAVLDAFSYGIPVITTPVGGIPDIANEGKNMLLFNPGDVETLAKKLRILIEDEELRKSLSEESKLMAATTFALHNVTRKLGEVYGSLV